MELLSEKVEKIETGFDASFSLSVMLRNMLISLSHALMLGMIGATVALMGLGLSLIPVIGPVLGVGLSLSVVPILVGFNAFDYPMTIRLWPLRDKLRFARRNAVLLYGFSLCTYIMLYVPILNLLLLPACVVASTRLLIELQAEGRADIRDRRKELLGEAPATESSS